MLAKTEDIAALAQTWLAQFEQALRDETALAALFHADGYWRDVLAFTWDIATVHGRDAIARALTAQAGRTGARRVELAPNRTPPRQVTRAGTPAIEAIFRFETAQGRGSGVVRLVTDAGE